MNNTIRILLALLFLVCMVLLSVLISKWIWGSNLPEWLKVLMIAG